MGSVVGGTGFKYVCISLCSALKFSRERETNLYKMYLYCTGYNIGTDLLKLWKNTKLRRQVGELQIEKVAIERHTEYERL